MNVSYTGIKNGLPGKLQDKLDHKFAKISKLVDGRGEKLAHVVVTSERHLHKAEITLNVHNHQLIGIGSDGDVFAAISSALDRLEKQAVKQGAKWRDSTRRSEPMKAASAKAAPASSAGGVSRHIASSPSRSRRALSQPGAFLDAAAGKAVFAEGHPAKSSTAKGKPEKAVRAGSEARIFRPDDHERRKPITLEEALIEMEDGRDYVAYRDADKQVVCMLIRRRDGHYDLIETSSLVPGSEAPRSAVV